MSITLSPAAAAKAADIPDFSERLERFVDQQYELEQWRSRRYSAKTRALVEEGMAMGRELKKSGTSRDGIFEQLMVLYDNILVPEKDHE